MPRVACGPSTKFTLKKNFFGFLTISNLDLLGTFRRGALIGKPAGIFFSTGTQAGGQETTALTTLPVLAHHGMIIVPTGYASPHMTNMAEIRGGTTNFP